MEKQSLSQQAYSSIKQKIVSLALPPGEVIDEAALREELGLGRTPIREALQRLAQEKLVLIVPRRGMFVTEIGIADLQQLFEARLELETFATRLAAQRGTAVHWQPMEAALTRFTIDENLDNQSLIEIDEICHRLIYDAAENKFLKNTLITMYALSLRLWYFALSKIGNMHDAVLDHQHMLEALKAGDAELASELMEKHIRTFQQEMQKTMIGMPTL